MVKKDPVICKLSESFKEEVGKKDNDDNSLVDKRAGKKGKSKLEAEVSEIDKEYTILNREDETIKKVLHEIIMHPMANTVEVFDN